MFFVVVVVVVVFVAVDTGLPTKEETVKTTKNSKNMTIWSFWIKKAENKSSSKSIGRNPSRSFKSLDTFRSKVLKHVEKEYLNAESNNEEFQQD